MKKLLFILVLVLSTNTFALTGSSMREANGSQLNTYSDGTTSETMPTANGGSVTFNSNGNTVEMMPSPPIYPGSNDPDPDSNQ